MSLSARRFCASALPTRQTWIFSTEKRSSAGEISKNSKSQGWRGVSSFGWQTAGLSSGILLEMGSSLVVDRHQKWTKSRIVTRQGGFFFGFAEQKPDVLGGEMQLGQPLAAHFWFLVAIGGFWYNHKWNQFSSCLFRLSALIAVSDNLRQLELVPPRRLFKLRGVL